MSAAGTSGPPTGWRLWLAGARPRTLPAAVVPVLVGTACAAGVPHAEGSDGWFLVAPDSAVTYLAAGGWPLKGIIVWRFLAALVVALAIQIGTNYANDYSDGVRGTDDATRVGPLRLVGSGLVEPRKVKLAAFASFGVAALAGLTLAAAVGWWLILVGLACLAAGWFYTGGPRPYGYAGLGEVFVFVFFGLVATVGSAYVQTEALYWDDPLAAPSGDLLSARIDSPFAGFSTLLFGAAVAVGCLATALLVVNNLRDIHTDAVAGKRTLAVAIGEQATRTFYAMLVLLPFAFGPAAALVGGRPLALLCLVALVPAVGPVRAVVRGAAGRELLPVLGRTGMVQLVFGVLFALGAYLSAPVL